MNDLRLLQLLGGNGNNSGFSPASSIPAYSCGCSDDVAPDLKTAIGKQRKPYSINDSLAKVNPEYAIDTGNCTRCVVAYELRRRGYRVTALSSYNGDKWRETAIGGILGADRWRGAFKGAETVNVGSLSFNRTVKNITDAMHGYGLGSRAVISINYAHHDYGHVFNVENVNGRVQFLEAQTGQRLNKNEVKEYFDKSDLYGTTLTRTDHLRISDRAKYFVKQDKK